MIWTIKATALMVGLGWGVSALAEATDRGATPAPSEADPAAFACYDTAFDNASFTYCEVDPAQAALRLFLYDRDDQPWGQFSRLGQALRADGQALVVAMNAGMYHPDRSPVGLYIEGGQTVRSVVRGASPGNFGLVPNGVLCIRPGEAEVIETERFVSTEPECRDATQSGPMLVVDGELHPRFLVDSTSRYIRNGVGSRSEDGMIVMAISNEPVTFHHFGRFFRDRLNTDQALFLDGNISRFHAVGLGRSDAGWAMGPMLGVVVPEPEKGDDSAEPAG